MSRPKGTFQSPPEMIFRAAELFLEGTLTVKQISELLQKEFSRSRIHRQEIYRLLQHAVHLKYLRLVPPTDKTLAEELAKRFEFKDQNVLVVRTHRAEDNHQIAEAAAEVAMSRTAELLKRGKHSRVGLGLTTGRACWDFSRRFSQLMQEQGNFPLSLHALAGGGPTDPEYSPISFFSFFRRPWSPSSQHEQPLSVGLFSPTLCRSKKELAKIHAQADFQKALQHKKEINLICAAIGVQCEHDLLGRAVEDEMLWSGNKSFKFAEWAKSRDIVGNVNYRPYTSSGEPYLEKDNEYRAITLFEISDLLKFRQNGGILILMGRRCALCNTAEAAKQRAKGLLPLLKSPLLRVFSDLVIDAELVRLILDMSQASD